MNRVMSPHSSMPMVLRCRCRPVYRTVVRFWKVQCGNGLLNLQWPSRTLPVGHRQPASAKGAGGRFSLHFFKVSDSVPAPVRRAAGAL